MSKLFVQFNQVSFGYDRATEVLFHEISFHLAAGWTAIVGANGVGKTSLLKLAMGILEPRQGQVTFSEHGIYCQQRTDHAPDRFHELIHAIDADAFRIKAKLGIEDHWLGRWHTLSHGERKRAQIAVALWQRPSVLAVDEPTNHLDSDAQDVLFAALSSYRGVGMLVSHDRRLLDELCHHCIFIEPTVVTLRPGNYSQGYHQAHMEVLTAKKQREQAKRDYSRIKRASSKRRDAASQANRRRSKGGLATKNHDAREKINAARVTGKDGSAGSQLNQLKGRLWHAQKKLDALRVKKDYKLGIWMPGAKSHRNVMFNLPAGSLSLGGDTYLHFPNLSMRPEDRIGITGANGSGKSTLIQHILASLHIRESQLTYVPQEIGLAASQAVLKQAKEIANEKLGKMMTVVSCLGSRPQRLLESPTPSPGEVRKILLATGIANVPHLIIMDEPTNHLDLPSIECLEQALSGCPCGLILVSHDRRFMNALVQTRWHISGINKQSNDYILEPQ